MVLTLGPLPFYCYVSYEYEFLWHFSCFVPVFCQNLADGKSLQQHRVELCFVCCNPIIACNLGGLHNNNISMEITLTMMSSIAWTLTRSMSLVELYHRKLYPPTLQDIPSTTLDIRYLGGLSHQDTSTWLHIMITCYAGCWRAFTFGIQCLLTNSNFFLHVTIRCVPVRWWSDCVLHYSSYNCGDGHTGWCNMCTLHPQVVLIFKMFNIAIVPT